MLSGNFDGSDRDHFFQVSALRSDNALEPIVTPYGRAGSS
jgi:hypothetical protein